jgi:PAS domain S-box-containing protein
MGLIGLKTRLWDILPADDPGIDVMDTGYSWLALLIESSFASRLLINRNNSIVFANRAAHALFGYSNDELVGKPVDVIFASRNDRETAIPRMPLFSPRMAGDDCEIKGLTKGGAELTLRVGTAPIDTLSESFLSVTIFDVTIFKEKEQEILFRVRQLEEGSKRVSKFAHLVAHELRNDLLEILSVSSKLGATLAESRQKEAAEACSVMHDLASRACDVVGDLLEYSEQASSVLSVEDGHPDKRST